MARETRLRGSRGALFCALVSVSFAPSAAPPCAADASLEMQVEITPTLATGFADRTLRVRVHTDGCVSLHRPSFYRGAGDYRLTLAPNELASLRNQAAAPLVRGFDATRVVQHLRGEDVRRGAAQRRSEEFAVLDGDDVRVTWGDAARASVQFNGLLDYAEQYPDVAELQALGTLVQSLQALVVREDAVKVDGAHP